MYSTSIEMLGILAGGGSTSTPQLTPPLCSMILASMSPPRSSSATPDLTVKLAGLTLCNPVMTASGTAGYGPEYAELLDPAELGAFVTKSVTVERRRGNPPERTAETAAGMLNAIGLANVGLACFVAEKVPFLKTLPAPVIVNVAGHCVEDYVKVCRKLDRIDCIAGLELNVSCPNVADGLEFGTDAARLEELVAAVRREVRRAKLIVKLSPNVTDITTLAAAAIAGGAEILSLINTLRGMAINVESRRPILANCYGGLSGPAVKPVALALVHRVYTKVAQPAGVPLIGMGGISTWRDVVEFMLAGASAVAVGTALLVDPTTPRTICRELSSYLHEQGLRRASDLVGQVEAASGTHPAAFE